MKSSIEITEGPEISNRFLIKDLPISESLAPTEETPDARIFLTDKNQNISAFAALWWKDTPSLPGKAIGTIGGFAAKDESSAKKLLEAACNYLKQTGCSLAVGPMNGNTWRNYRFVTHRGERNPFLLEPRNPDNYPHWWQKSDFQNLSHYSSSLIVLDGMDSISPALKARLLRSGLIIRELDPNRYDEELRIIHALSLKSFADNFLYTPLEEKPFLTAYQKVKNHIDPDFIRIAERNGIPCGFVFGIPDLEAAARGEKPAIIVKTLAVDPTAHCSGLGSLLVDELHRIAYQKGYTEAIHALQHETNTSLKITGRHQGQRIRKYTLFSRSL